jgi:hypothetical protein
LESVEYWGTIGLASLLGAAFGWALAMRVSRANFVAQLRATADELEHRQAAAASELRAAQARAENELERLRQTYKRKLANAADGPRVALLETEERLRAVYTELERLRRSPLPPIASRAPSLSSRFSRLEFVDTEGFPSTLSMPD